MNQKDMLRTGVHLEHIGVSKWRLTGLHTVFIVREERLVHKTFEPTGRKVKRPVWVVKNEDTELDEGTAFETAGLALFRGYEKAGALPLEI